MTDRPSEATIQERQRLLHVCRTEHEWAASRILHLEHRTAELVEALEALQWNAYDEDRGPCCPYCGARRSIGEHELDCQLATLIARHKEQSR